MYTNAVEEAMLESYCSHGQLKNERALGAAIKRTVKTGMLCVFMYVPAKHVFLNMQFVCSSRLHSRL